jgi:enoyl-CoA hydratase
MTDEILFERRGAIGLATLNRPAALNALNRPMALAYHRQLDAWAADDAVQAVVLTGTGDRAFCAGGDVVGLHRDGRAGSPDFEGFFADEYRMNRAIARFSKPHVALLDGVTMGGGVGLSIHGPYRVATERTLFAMPETGIGLIPDVGGTHALPRLPGEVGAWLGLTGARLRAADCLEAGIATHHVESSRLPDLIDALASGGEPAETLAKFHTRPAGEATLPALREAIDRHFAHDSVADILASLERGDEWAQAQAATIRAMSPTSLVITLAALRAGRGASIEDCLIREYRMVSAIKSGHDFFEGVRAQLIDKDRNPRWSPATLADVDPEPFFARPPGAT